MSYLATGLVRAELLRIATDGFGGKNLRNITTIRAINTSEPFVLVDKASYISGYSLSQYREGYELSRGSLLVKLHKRDIPKEIMNNDIDLDFNEGVFFRIIAGYTKDRYELSGEGYSVFGSDYFFITKEKLSNLNLKVVKLKDIKCNNKSIYTGTGTEVETTFVDAWDVMLCNVIQPQDMRPDFVRYYYTPYKNKVKVITQIYIEGKWSNLISAEINKDKSFSQIFIMKFMDDLIMEELEKDNNKIFTDEEIYKIYISAPPKIFELGISSPRTLEHYLTNVVSEETLDKIINAVAKDDLSTERNLEELMAGMTESFMKCK